MNETPPVQLQPGMLVFTSDGDELGRVKEIEGVCFKLDAPAAVDFWLDLDAVASTEFGMARLNLPKDAFNRNSRTITVGPL